VFNNNTTGTEIYASGQTASAQQKCRKKKLYTFGKHYQQYCGILLLIKNEKYYFKFLMLFSVTQATLGRRMQYYTSVIPMNIR
jgi:hypothetical protein